MAGGDWAAAESHYQRLLTLEPTNIYGLVGLGKAARMRGDPALARARFEQAAIVHPRNTWPLLELANLHSAAGRISEAEQALVKGLARNAKDQHILAAYARLLRNSGKYARSAEIYRSLIELHPALVAPRIEVLHVLSRLGHLDEAAAAVVEARATFGPLPQILLAEVRLHRAAGRRDDYLRSLQEAATVFPVDQPAQRLELGRELATAGRHSAALDVLNSLAADDTLPQAQRLEAMVAAAGAARQCGRRDEALTLAERIVVLDAGNVAAWCELGALREANHLEQAEQAYKKALSLAPQSLSALVGLAMLARHRGDRRASLDLFMRAHDADIRNDWVRLELGHEHNALGETALARQWLSSVSTGSNHFVAAQVALGHLARELGDFAGAATCFERAAEGALDPMAAWNELAALARQRGDFAEARRWIELMLKHDPQRALIAEGFVKRAEGDRQGALASFEMARAANGQGTANALAEMAEELMALGDSLRAMRVVQDALVLDSSNAGALLKKAELLKRAGDENGALGIWADLRLRQPVQPWGYLTAAAFLSNNARFEEAKALLIEARTKCPPSVHIEHRWAELLRCRGLMDEYDTCLNQVRRRYPRDFWIWFQLASLAVENGRWAEAEALLFETPAASRAELAHVQGLKSLLAEKLWQIEEAISCRFRALELDASDAQSHYELARLQLLVFDLVGCRHSLLTHAKYREGAMRLRGCTANVSQSLVGQLLNEYTMDKECEAGLVGAAKLAPADQVALMADLVRQFPDSTAPAMGLLIALRRAGLLERHAAPNHDVEPIIPRKLAQYWNDAQRPVEIHEYMDTWARNNPGFNVQWFDDSRALDFIQEHASAHVVRAFRSAQHPAQRGDLFRLVYLLHEGGYYADADDRCRGPIDLYLPRDCALVGYQENVGSIANNFLGAAPGHPVIETALDHAVNAVSRGDRDIIWLSTGPGLLTRSLASWLASEPDLMEMALGAVVILGIEAVRPVAAMHCSAGYKTTDRAWLRSAFQRGGAAIGNSIKT